MAKLDAHASISGRWLRTYESEFEFDEFQDSVT
jgi:hypothetical protein